MLEKRNIDACLSHPTPFGQYHYHAWSPCLKTSWSASTTDAPEFCKNVEECEGINESNTLSEYILARGFYEKEDHGGVIGIAKDGHLLVGPYKSDDGTLWSCSDHDICNGVMDDNGNYLYAATNSFPYQVGCWGPAAV